MSPCQRGAGCSGLPGGDYNCACPTGINGKNCDIVFTALDSGIAASCGLRSDRKMRCWGSDEFTGAQTPVGTFRSISMAPNDVYACGIRSNYPDANCWGPRGLPGGDFGQAYPPTTNFLALSSGNGATCGIAYDRSITCWGARSDGAPITPPTEAFAALSYDDNFGCGITIHGTLSCWGTGGFGPETIPPSGTFRAVTAGYYRPCAVRSDDRVTCWGVFADQLPPTNEP